MNMKEIAKRAGVSIATVSHVVNKTRFVSAELTERVLKVIEEMDDKPGFLLRSRKALESGNILVFAENLTDYFYIDIIKGIKERAQMEDMHVIVLNSGNKGLLHEYIRLEKPAGVIFLTGSCTDDGFSKIKDIGIPSVFIGHEQRVTEKGSVIFNFFECAYKGTYHFIKSGHDRVCFIHAHPQRRDLMLSGYKQALHDNGIAYDPSLVVDVAMSMDVLEKLWLQDNRPTAILSADEMATAGLLKFLNSHNLKCPDDLSLVSLHDFNWSDFMRPSITTVSHDPVEIGNKSVEKLVGKMKASEGNLENTWVESKIKVRNSDQSIAKGPLGERAESPDILHLSASDMEWIKSNVYTAAISFHYSGTAWARLHEKGIKDVFSELGIKVLVVTDAHFDPELQNKQHESIMTMKPDILISIPADEVLTAASYRKIVDAGIKLVLINNVPEGFARQDYVTCVSVNERENGQIAGRILGEHLKKRNKKKIGLVIHGAAFFATKQRDQAAEQVLTEEYPELEIVAVERFVKEARVFDQCYEMIRNHPEIEGLYVSWEGPAMTVLNVLRELGREDICMVTADLDSGVALSLAGGGPVIGISAQRPYDQGRAIALSAANALIGRQIPSFIGVSPYKVTADNLLTAWQDVLKERAPAQVVEALKSNRIR